MAKKWYVVHTYSGYEKKVHDDLLHRIETFGASDSIVDIQIPKEMVTEVKEGGKRSEKEQKIFPGYVLVRMEMNDHTWSIVRDTPGVTGFVGVNGEPIPLSREEFNKIMNRTEPGQAPKHTAVDIEVGQTVRIVSGSLTDFDGTVTEVNPESGKVRVNVTLFGRETAVELTFDMIRSI
ncbi:MAG: transcription termination/antitermination factor NusG [Coriobacteriales bacterium]|nr:transcription termination/antitermination factor NusG [Coriobacteriales bacterium]